MCIHCDVATAGNGRPASVVLRADGQDFYCLVCEQDDSRLPEKEEAGFTLRQPEEIGTWLFDAMPA